MPENVGACVLASRLVMRLLPNVAHSGALSSVLLCVEGAYVETECSEHHCNERLSLSPPRMRSQSVVLVPM